MTNNASVVVYDMPNGKSAELVFMTDSMGSTKHEKNDSAQKLFLVDKHLVMGAGHSCVLQDAIASMENHSFGTPRELAIAIIEYTNKLSLEPKEQTQFIIGGMEDSEPSTYKVRTAVQPPNGKPQQGSITRVGDALGGSGSRFGEPYDIITRKTGSSIFPETVAEALLKAYDLTKEGSFDRGVNDKLQIGIISRDGVAQLYHPDIKLSPNSFKRYIADMTGIARGESSSFAQQVEESNKTYLAKESLRSVYQALESDLRSYSETKKWFTHAAELWSYDRTDLEGLRSMKLQKREFHNAIMQAATALKSKDFHKLCEYLDGYRARQVAIEDKVKQYLKK